jgi:lactate 2-monooxygenase
MVQDPNAFANFQYEIYLGGLADRAPELPFTWRELEEQAREKLTPGAYGYVAGGAGSEDTMRANLEAFRKWRIVPRMLRDIAVRDLSTTLFDTTTLAPVLLAPIGVQSIVHPDAEVAVARAASSLGVPIVLSTASSKSMEEVAEAMGDTPRWFQLYWPRDRELTKSLLSRAEAAGYSAVAVTLDTWLIGWRPRDLALAYLPFLKAEGMANYLTDPVFRGQLEKSPEDDPQAAVVHFGTVFSDPTVTWDDLRFLRDSTDLPILLKGILHPDDARRAVELGMDGIVVSNHGGRQVDGAIGSFDALPSVVAAVPDDYPVLLDSGVRTGADAFKAIALGARAVFLGRPYMWGLGLGGEEGVRHVVRSFLADLDLTLALSGYTSFQQVDEKALVHSE